MKINYSLLDQLKQYFQGELDPTTAQDITKKLQEDPIYQAHAYVYKVSQKGISAHQRQKQLDGIKDFPSTIDVEAIWEQDRQLNRKKRWIVGLLAMLIMVAATTLVLKLLSAKPVPAGPIAEQDTESEILFGSEGQEQLLSLVPLRWDASNSLIPLEAKEELIVLHRSRPHQMSFKWASDTLHLYTPKVDYDTVQWVISSKDSLSVILRLDAQLFDLPKQQLQGQLQASSFSLKDLPRH